MMLVAKLFTVNKEFIDAVPLVSLRWTRQTNKEYTFNVKFALSPPENTYYIKIIDQDSSLKFIPSGYLSKSSSLTEYTLNSWETALDSEGWIPDGWQWWDNKLLSVVIADHCYGFRKIGISNTTQLSSFVDYDKVVVSAINDGNGSVYLDTHGYFIEESETEIAYYESGFAIYRIQIPSEARRPGMVLRWSDSVGGTTDISVQFRWSNLPYDYEGPFTEEVSPARSDNVNPNETKGIDVPESSLTYLFIKFNLKYDAGTNGVNYENEITTESGIVYYGKTPLLSAFELIYRVATSVSPGIIDVPVKTLTADVHGKSSLLESLKAISEAYDLVFMCDIDSSGVVTLNCYSEYGDNIRSTAGILSDIKNINVSDKSETLEIIEGVHCFGAGDGIDKLYSFVKMSGVDTPKKVSTFEDGDITNITDLELAGAQYLEDENSISSKVTFEYYGEPRISLNDFVSIVSSGAVYENKISEESIDCGSNGVESRKYTIGFKAYPFRKLYGYTFSGSYLKTPKTPSSVTAKEVEGTWYLSWVGSADSFLIEYKKSSATIWNRTTVSTNYCTIANIQQGTEYLFRVYSVIDGSISDASTTISTSGNSEDQLTPNEKTQYRIQWDDLASKKPNADTSADLYGLSTEKTTFDNAFQALANYLNNGVTWVSGVPLWLSDAELQNTTIIDFDTFRSLWASATSGYDSIIDGVRNLASISVSLTSNSASRNRAGDISPVSVTAFSKKVDGSLYSGRFIISASYDGISYIDLYTSSSDESSKAFDIPAKIEIESIEYYVVSVRFRIYKAGGTTIQLSQSVCTVQISTDTTPVYWGSRTSAPTTEPFLENDYYFDSNSIVDGGGKIRYFNGSIWVEATSSWNFYSTAISSAITDMMVWVGATGGTIAAANAVFESIVASTAFINSLSTSVQYSALKCDDGITPRMEIDWDKASAIFRSQNGYEETRITENKVVSYSGKGVFRRGVSIKSDSVAWVSSDEYGEEFDIARIRRLGVGSSTILMDGNFSSKKMSEIFTQLSDITSSPGEVPAYIKMNDGTTRIAYVNSYNGLLVEKILTNGIWGSESLITNFQASQPEYIQMLDGTLKIMYVRNSNEHIEEKTYADGSWGDYSIGYEVSDSVSSFPSCIQTLDGVFRIVYTKASAPYNGELVERKYDFINEIWGDEEHIADFGIYPNMIETYDGILRLAYRYGDDLFERKLISGVWSTASVISSTGATHPNYTELADLTLKILYCRASDSYIVERTLVNNEWSEESVIINSASLAPAQIQLDDGTIRISYVDLATLNIKEALIERYQSLSYPQSGYVSGRGWWTKFADGTLIQRSVPLPNPTFTVGTYLHNAAQASMAWTLPVSFYDVNYDAVGGFSHGESIGLSGYWGPYENSKTVNIVNGRAVCPSNYSAGTMYLRIVAIGRWKA